LITSVSMVLRMWGNSPESGISFPMMSHLM
jgi:hypothetical protein